MLVARRGDFTEAPNDPACGVPPSDRHVWWTGMPIFTFEGAKVRDLFVLGDIHGLIGRLKGGP